MNVIASLASSAELPRMCRVRQRLDDSFLNDEAIRRTIQDELSRAAIRELIKPGMRIAVTCGSRGVANIALIVRTTVEFLQEFGARPFIVPAMGSHGGGTAEGQRQILASYGVTEETMGCPILSSMEVKQIGCVHGNVPLYMDKNAAESDGIVVLGRIKPHTGFRGKYESGLMKMMVIGLGKQKGAEICHMEGFSRMAENIETFGKAIIQCAPVLFGLGIIENSCDQTWKLAALLPEEIIEKEPEYLLEAKKMIPMLPFQEIDVLVVDRIGKDISGDGMDPNITGTFCSPYASGGIHTERVVILDLTEASHGCAIGMGMADFTTRRLYDKIDFDASYPNAITSKMVVQAKIPMVLANDREAIQIALKTCTHTGNRPARIVRISDTLHLDEYWISEGLLPEVKDLDDITVMEAPRCFEFDDSGAICTQVI